MRSSGWACLVLVLALAAGRPATADKTVPVVRPAPSKTALQPIPPSRAERERAGALAYQTHCAGCHGPAARGDGPLGENLRFRPADLTLIARRNRGQFPAERVFRAIDGREAGARLGASDMPIWADAFKDAETGYDDRIARERIGSLVEYLRGIQTR